LSVRRLAPLLLVLVALAPGGDGRPAVSVERFDGGVTFRNLDGDWTVYTRCFAGAGPGYVARLVRTDGVVVTDDRHRRGGSNRTGNGGLGEFGWHGARRHGAAFDYDFAWTIDGRMCGNVGVGRAAVVDSAHVVDGVGRMTIDVFLRDNHVASSTPMVRVRYRYRVYPHVVHAAIGVTELCRDGDCGWQGRAYIKEPKLQASVTGGGYARMVVLDADGRVARNVVEHRGSPCVWSGADARRQTGQCDDPQREVVRFEGPSVPALNVRMTAVGHLWQSGRGLDGWALASASRPEYARRDSLLDGVRWGCKASSTASPLLRRWELGGGARRDGTYVAASAMFPAWEGGRGFGDCEPLSRTFGPRGESWNVLAAYWLSPPSGV
jgi:hypothetical protein